MRRVLIKFKPASGFAHFVYVLFNLLLPVLLFVFVRLDFVGLAVALILLSKWRMFVVRPRHWPAIIRANAVDIIVGLSFLIFMTHSDSQSIQLFWALAYAIWLMVLKPRSDNFSVAAQAFVAQFIGLTAIFLNWGDASVLALVSLGWLICYSAARHFLTSYDEPLTRYLANSWAFFASAMVWVLSHWLLFYGVIAQPTLLLCVIGFSLAGIYYLDQADRLSALVRRQLVFVMMGIVFIVLVFSNWGDKGI